MKHYLDTLYDIFGKELDDASQDRLCEFMDGILTHKKAIKDELYIIRIEEFYQVFDDKEKYNKRIEELDKNSKEYDVSIDYVKATVERRGEYWDSGLPF